MSTVVAIKGTNGSGKSTVVRALITHLGKQSILRVNSKEAGYRCNYEDGSLFVLGKYKTAACGGLDSSFSYGGAADDLFLCIDKLAPQGHVCCEGVIAITSYGHDRVARFADKLRRKGHRMIFAHIDTPAELCIERVKQRRMEVGNAKPFNPEKLLEKYDSILKSQEKLKQAGYDARILPHEEPLQTLLRWFEERTR
jgi:energy-coupling factor transporter ATP-binding protein EcfA2